MDVWTIAWRYAGGQWYSWECAYNTPFQTVNEATARTHYQNLVADEVYERKLRERAADNGRMVSPADCVQPREYRLLKMAGQVVEETA